MKEHIFALGRRPKDFYNQINDLPNVYFAHSDELGLEYVKNCQAVACITGTAAWEAVVMGIPVISFSKNNTWNFLNHVYFVNNYDNLRHIFLSIIKEKYPNKKSITEGANFYTAYLNKLISTQNYNNITPLSNDLKEMSQGMKDHAQVIFQSLKKKLRNY